MFTIATRLVAASTAGVLTGVLSICMIFASPAPSAEADACIQAHCEQAFRA